MPFEGKIYDKSKFLFLLGACKPHSSYSVMLQAGVKRRPVMRVKGDVS